MRLFEGDLAASLHLADLRDWSRRAIDVLAEETKQPKKPAAQQMSYARALGGGRSTCCPQAVSSVRTPGPVSATKRTHQFPGTDRPGGSLLVRPSMRA